MAKKRFSKSNVLWFIRSRAYTPVGDLRRRFRLDAEEMAMLPDPSGNVYIGLPDREANMIHQLWTEGKIGLECAPGMHVRVVEGVYPMPSAGRKEGEELEADELGEDAEGNEAYEERPAPRTSRPQQGLGPDQPADDWAPEQP